MQSMSRCTDATEGRSGAGMATAGERTSVAERTVDRNEYEGNGRGRLEGTIALVLHSLVAEAA